MAKKKYVYMFSETDETMKNLVGGKGANLGQMTKLGLPIPQGFTVTTEACTEYYNSGRMISDDIVKQITSSLEELEKITEKKFGNPENPLLVSVRSGARVSMPGMMDTILNLGLNEEVVEGLSKKTNNPRFAYDSYRRFIQMYSDVVMELPKHRFEEIIDEMKKEKGIKFDTEFTSEDLVEMIKKFKAFYKKELKQEFPTDPKEQLFGAIGAVFKSWENPRAIYYREVNEIPSSWGTAVNVQSMVYGNMGKTSGTGVAFTRNPSTGENKLYGEYLIDAQGEDVVAGVRTPSHISKLEEDMPKVFKQFCELSDKLENHFRDMQDIEFTIEHEKLYFLQTRNGKRTPQAALKVAVDLVNEKMITKEEAVMRVEPKQLDNLLHPQFEQSALKSAKVVAKGLPASPGAACGKIAFSVEKTQEYVKQGLPAVLVRLETSPEDIEGMHISEGFLTARGGMTSHAAVVARGMGKCCVSGCQDLVFVPGGVKIGNVSLKEGDFISLDGTTGFVYAEKISTHPAQITGDFATFMQWCDEFRRLEVRTNADTVNDAKQARQFGATGIGLCRTEHMFFDANRIKAMREMIIASTKEQREKALAKLLPLQRKDFEDLYEAMEGMPVTVRYLDPPLHEFLPKEEKEISELANDLGISITTIKDRISSLHEVNPMMGHRGCRLAVTYPELAAMQTRAVIEASINVRKRNPKMKFANPEIMIPLVGEINELKYVKDVVVKTADEIIKQNKVDLNYHVGTMIEIPRAALLADEIATEAQFFSFGTNDLTQMTFGFSRDDAAGFLESYRERKIFEFDPFKTVDQNGVGKLINTAVTLGKKTRKDIHLGVCGEHGGDPKSIEFFEKVGLDYVSCSPFRVPIARLAGAQAAILNKKHK